MLFVHSKQSHDSALIIHMILYTLIHIHFYSVPLFRSICIVFFKCFTTARQESTLNVVSKVPADSTAALI